MPDVLVVVPARNAEATLGACLDALAAQVDGPSFEVVIVDDGSTDGTRDVAERHTLRPRLVTGTGRGSYAARNTGARAADSELLAFTDADCIPSERWLAAGWAATLADPAAGLVGGRIDWTPTPGTAIADYDRGSYLDQRRSIADQGYAATANLFVRRSAFDALDGFDGSLRSGGDIEFCRRAGHPPVYCDDASVAHRPRETYADLWRLHRRLGAGWAALAARGERPPWWRDGALRTPTLGMVVETLDAAGRHRRRRDLLGAHVVVRSARVVGRLLG